MPSSPVSLIRWTIGWIIWLRERRLTIIGSNVVPEGRDVLSMKRKTYKNRVFSRLLIYQYTFKLFIPNCSDSTITSGTLSLNMAVFSKITAPLLFAIPSLCLPQQSQPTTTAGPLATVSVPTSLPSATTIYQFPNGVLVSLLGCHVTRELRA